jgi:hypothetical protein
MPKRNSKSSDPNVMAHHTLEIITGENEGQPKLRRSLISEVMAEMGRKGGKKGGKRRLKTMTAEQRSQVALKAAQARWAKKR